MLNWLADKLLRFCFQIGNYCLNSSVLHIQYIFNVFFIKSTLGFVCEFEFPSFKAKGNVPHLAYHSAVIYQKELFVFGGIQASHSQGHKSCSNALYIFNPEHELWYKPIVEGNKPLSRFGSVIFATSP